MAAFQYDFFQHLFISLKHDKKTSSLRLILTPYDDVLRARFFAQKAHFTIDGAAFPRGYNFNTFMPTNWPYDG